MVTIKLKSHLWGMMGEVMKLATVDLVDRNIQEFLLIQEFMQNAKEEHAEHTYSNMKNRYTYLKASLTASGVNLSQLDNIKE